MALVICDAFEIVALGAITNRAAQSTNWNLELYSNNITPGETDTSATYTESVWTGYTAGGAALTGASWTAANPTTYAQQTFTSTAGSQSANNYGYWYRLGAAGNLVGAERFTDSPPYVIVNNGDAIKITPSVSAD